MDYAKMALRETHLSFPGSVEVYRGKVRDVYDFGSHILMVATDRISAFDHILPRAIPFKGQILNAIARKFLTDSSYLVPNWLDESFDIDPAVSFGRKADPIKIEMVIRGYCVGHAWREYKKGQRSLCGVPLPEGLKEGDAFPDPIITPSTKADEGHDEDISREEILDRSLISAKLYEQMERYTYELFSWGQEQASRRGLILADTKYEFGLDDKGQLMLIDEVLTPDSSRYFYAEQYEELREKGEKPKQLSKEFVREWLMSEGFQGKEGQEFPEMTDDVIQSIMDRYQELYEKLLGEPFQFPPSDLGPNERIQASIDLHAHSFPAK